MLTVLRRLRARVRRDRLDDELSDEIRDHLGRRTRQLVESGMDPAAAEAEARRRFGNVLNVREASRDHWGFPRVESVLQDARFGARLLRRSPAFTVVAVLSLTIAIGAVSAVASLADAVLMRRLPVRSPEQLYLARWISGPVLLFDSLSGYGQEGDTENSSTSFSLAAFEAIRDRAASLAEVIGFAELYRVNLGIGGEAELGSGQAVSGNYFEVLGVPPAAGRPLGPHDDLRSGPAVAMISHALWTRRFGASPDAVGRTLTINGVSATIVGVTPAGFRGTLQVGDAPSVFVPLALASRLERTDAHGDPNHWWVLMMARLRPGAAPADAASSFDAILKQSVAEHRPATKPEELPRIDLRPGGRGQLEQREVYGEALLIMGCVVAIVLLVACANLANLLLARASARAREVAMRVALGAPRSRIVRQFVTESLLLASLGGIGGLVVARWLVGYLATALDQSRMVDLAVPLDGRAVAVTLAVVGGSAVLFGLLPAVRGTRADVVREIRETGRGQTGHGRRFGVSAALVSLQVALSLMLVTGAALFVGSVRNLERVDAGFDPSNVVVFRLDPTLNGYEGERLRALYATLLDRLRALPAVVGATVSSHTLISGSAAISEVFGGDGAPHEPTAGHGASQGTGPARRRTLAWCLNIDDEFFRTMGMRVLRGRTFGPGDAPASQPVAVVNSTFARAVFEGDAPLGRRFRLSDRPGAPEYEVVGVVADARFSSIRADPPATVYLSYRQQDPGAMTVAVKSARSPLEILPAVRAAVADIDANVPLFDVRTQATQIAESLRQERLFAQLASALGAVTLLLAAVGLYGLLAGSVVRRIPEIGLRMALGADRRAVRWMVLRHSLVLVAIGVACGIPASLAGMRVVDSVLFGLTDVEVWVIAAATATLAAVSAIAAYLPARRASRIDPIAALRA